MWKFINTNNLWIGGENKIGGRGSSSGKSGGGGNKQFEEYAERILSPKTKEDFIDRAQFIADYENGRENAFKYNVYTTEWQNYGKDRTYIKIYEDYRSDNKNKSIFNMGFYDNKAGKYGTTPHLKDSSGDLGGKKLYDVMGQGINKNEIVEFLKKRKKKK